MAQQQTTFETAQGGMGFMLGTLAAILVFVGLLIGLGATVGDARATSAETSTLQAAAD